MVINMVNNSDTQDKYNFIRKGGKSIIERSPVFSPDGEALAVIVENIVRVYSLKTGDCVRTLETENPVKELIAIQFVENEDYNFYGCSEEGYVTTWTWEKGAVLREVPLNLNGAKVLTCNFLDNNECFITAIGKSMYLILAKYSIKTGELLYYYKQSQPDITNSCMVRVALGWCDGDRFAAVTNGTRKLYIQNLYRPHLRSIIGNHNQLRIMAVAAHQSSNEVAITDTLGRVTVIRGNLYTIREIAREVLHWHRLPPLAVCFSLQGSYLFSGGMEKVLVRYTVGSLALKHNEKAFIPRLPGMIRFISTNNTHIAITLTNNSIVIANAQMRAVGTLLECGGLSPAMRAGGSLVYHTTLRALLTPARAGHVQLYSAATDKVLCSIDVTEMNAIPPQRNNLLPVETEVTCTAVSANGKCLVTSEYRNDGVVYPEERLKFWTLAQKATTPFKLNTVVNLSHGGCKVVSIALNHKGEICVSAGGDQKFRVWKRELSPKQKVSWSCLTACYYSSGVSQYLSHGALNKFKNGSIFQLETNSQPSYMTEMKEDDVIPKLVNIHKESSLGGVDEGVRVHPDVDAGGVAVSQDGSLVAAWFGSKLTLWDTHACSLRTTLAHPALRPRGVDVQFGCEDAAHYLACTTEQCLAVWSLLSLTVKWLVHLRPTCLTADRFSNKMAVVTANNDVIIFSPQSSTPIVHRRRVLEPSSGVLRKAEFGSARLYLMRNNSEIYCVEPQREEDGQLEVISQRNLPQSNFSALVAEQTLSEVRPVGETAVDANSTGNAVLTQFVSAWPHMVPNVSLLCTSFLQQISGQQEQPEEDSQPDDAMDEDPASSDDEDSAHKHAFMPRITELWTPNYEAVKEKKLTKIVKEPFLDLHATSIVFGV